MKDRYRLVRRGNRYYALDRSNHTRESLELTISVLLGVCWLPRTKRPNKQT